jgi:choline dehydrogenase
MTMAAALSWGYGLTLHVCDLLPKSRGTISLASPTRWPRPGSPPITCRHPDDLPTLL